MNIINGINKIDVGDVIHIKGFFGYNALVIQDRDNGMKCAVDQYHYAPLVLYLQELKRKKHKWIAYRPHWVYKQTLETIKKWHYALSKYVGADTNRPNLIVAAYANTPDFHWGIESVKKAIKTNTLIEIANYKDK